jgi:hypothetical protein
VSEKHASAWLHRGTPAAVSVILGVVAGIWVSHATATRPGLSAVVGAIATVVAWALWEAWRAVRDGHEESGSGTSVAQTVRRVRGRLTGWTGPLAGRQPVRTSQKIGTVESGGEVVGIDLRDDRDRPSAD